MKTNPPVDLLTLVKDDTAEPEFYFPRESEEPWLAYGNWFRAGDFRLRGVTLEIDISGDYRLAISIPSERLYSRIFEHEEYSRSILIEKLLIEKEEKEMTEMYGNNQIPPLVTLYRGMITIYEAEVASAEGVLLLETILMKEKLNNDIFHLFWESLDKLKQELIENCPIKKRHSIH